MKPNPVRHALTTLLLTLHAGLALCGPGHHAVGVPGLARQEGARRPDVVVLVAASDPDAHCPVCDYLATPALLPPPPPHWLCHAIARAEALPELASPPGPPLRLARPRAPPEVVVSL